MKREGWFTFWFFVGVVLVVSGLWYAFTAVSGVSGKEFWETVLWGGMIFVVLVGGIVGISLYIRKLGKR